MYRSFKIGCTHDLVFSNIRLIFRVDFFDGCIQVLPTL